MTATRRSIRRSIGPAPASSTGSASRTGRSCSTRTWAWPAATFRPPGGPATRASTRTSSERTSRLRLGSDPRCHGHGPRSAEAVTIPPQPPRQRRQQGSLLDWVKVDDSPGHIPFNHSRVVGTEQAYIAEAIASGRLSAGGPFTERCARWLVAETGCDQALLVHSATAALELAALLLDVEP